MQEENPNKYTMNFDMYFTKDSPDNDPFYYYHIHKSYWIIRDLPKGSIIRMEDQQEYTTLHAYNKNYKYSCRYIQVNEQKSGIPVGKIMGIYIPEKLE